MTTLVGIVMKTIYCVFECVSFNRTAILTLLTFMEASTYLSIIHKHQLHHYHFNANSVTCDACLYVVYLCFRDAISDNNIQTT
jgi:hypothetical protein